LLCGKLRDNEKKKEKGCFSTNKMVLYIFIFSHTCTGFGSEKKKKRKRKKKKIESVGAQIIQTLIFFLDFFSPLTLARVFTEAFAFRERKKTKRIFGPS